MEDKVVFITGSSSGIGESTAYGFAKLACRLVIHGTDEVRVKQVAEKCYQLSPRHYKPLQVIGDVSDKKQCERIIKSIGEHWNHHLDVLVNNVGLFQPCNLSASNALDNYTKLMQVNLDSAVTMTILSLPLLRKSSSGCIINISSNLHAKCIANGFAYCTAKAGLTMFTKCAAIDLAKDNIRVNSISPGPVATRMSTRCGMRETEFRRLVGNACLVDRVGEADEVARAVLFLASPDSSFITGTDFIIDGGSAIKPEGKVMGSGQNE